MPGNEIKQVFSRHFHFPFPFCIPFFISILHSIDILPVGFTHEINYRLTHPILVASLVLFIYEYDDSYRLRL